MDSLLSLESWCTRARLSSPEFSWRKSRKKIAYVQNSLKRNTIHRRLTRTNTGSQAHANRQHRAEVSFKGKVSLTRNKTRNEVPSQKDASLTGTNIVQTRACHRSQAQANFVPLRSRKVPTLSYILLLSTTQEASFQSKLPSMHG